MKTQTEVSPCEALEIISRHGETRKFKLGFRVRTVRDGGYTEAGHVVALDKRSGMVTFAIDNGNRITAHAELILHA